MRDRIRGRAWKFENNIDTDVMISGKYLGLPMDELKRHTFEEIRPEFAERVGPSDLIVAGRNFGCGSSREEAPRALKALGLGAVVAESVARTFYRNAIAIGLPVIVCPGAGAFCSDGDEVEIDFTGLQIVNYASGEILDFPPFPDEMLRVLEAGGIEPLLKCMTDRS
jgi:3-isopropylmalate dehydratase small subunit